MEFQTLLMSVPENFCLNLISGLIAFVYLRFLICKLNLIFEKRACLFRSSAVVLRRKRRKACTYFPLIGIHETPIRLGVISIVHS